MADVGRPEIVFQCTYDNGRHGELILPRETAKESTTGGKQEAFVFLHRLEAARKTIELVPHFRTSFREQFTPIFLDLIYRRLTLVIAGALLDKLANVTSNDTASIRDCCDRFPYLRVKQQSPRLKVEIVSEAILPELMISEVQKILDPAVKLGWPLEEAADLAMSHILAWTLEDFAHDQGLLCEVATLGLEEADGMIWDRAWLGPHFLERFQSAVELSAETAIMGILEILDLPKCNLQHLEAMIGLRSPRYYLGIASTAKYRRHPVFNWVINKYLGLDSSYALAVAEALRKVEWRGIAEEPARRKLVVKESLRKCQELDLTVLDFLGGMPAFEGPNPNHWFVCLQPFFAGQGLPVEVPELNASKKCFGNPEFSAVNSLISLKEAIRKSDLSLDAERLIYAKIQGYGREEAAVTLNISSKRASAASKLLDRREKHFRNSMMGKPKKCPDIRR